MSRTGLKNIDGGARKKKPARRGARAFVFLEKHPVPAIGGGRTGYEARG
jgi:hypothetical protein